MSYVLTIRRAEGEVPLDRHDIDRLLAYDDSLSLESDEVIVWRHPDSGEAFHINLEASSLWTDSSHGVAGDVFLPKLRDIATTLDARILGEEGEDLSEAEVSESSGGVQVLHGMLGALIFVLSLPVLALVIVIRIPSILWKIYRLR